MCPVLPGNCPGFRAVRRAHNNMILPLFSSYLKTVCSFSSLFSEQSGELEHIGRER